MHGSYNLYHGSLLVNILWQKTSFSVTTIMKLQAVYTFNGFITSSRIVGITYFWGQSIMTEEC